jgi:hypothetical protein
VVRPASPHTAGRRYIGIEMLAQYHRAGTERLAAMHRAVNTPAANDEWLPEAAMNYDGHEALRRDMAGLANNIAT